MLVQRWARNLTQHALYRLLKKGAALVSKAKRTKKKSSKLKRKAKKAKKKAKAAEKKTSAGCVDCEKKILQKVTKVLKKDKAKHPRSSGLRSAMDVVNAMKKKLGKPNKSTLNKLLKRVEGIESRVSKEETKRGIKGPTVAA